MTAPLSLSGSTRREILVGATALAGAAALPRRASAQNGRKTRWEANDPDIPRRVFEDYERAVGMMLALPPEHPNNWYRHALTHTLDCPHGNWWFLPWHRAYSYWLERTCADLLGKPDFALPYWDWTHRGRIPDAVIGNGLDPTTSGFIQSRAEFARTFAPVIAEMYASFTPRQLADLARRGEDFSSPEALLVYAGSVFFGGAEGRNTRAPFPDLNPSAEQATAMPILTQILSIEFYSQDDTARPSGFGSGVSDTHVVPSEGAQGILESQPHNLVHNSIGGMMGDLFSPSDPIFFLHHGNIDRIWDVWARRQASHERSALPGDADLPRWREQAFRFFYDEAGDFVSTSAGEYDDMARFDYAYSPGSGENMVDPTGDGPLSGPRVVEVTIDHHRGHSGAFDVVADVPGGPSVVIGGVAAFGHLPSHGPLRATIPLPRDLEGAAQLEGGHFRTVPAGVAGRATDRVGLRAFSVDATDEDDARHGRPRASFVVKSH